MQSNIRPRLKRVLLTLAEDKNQTREKRLEAAEQLIALLTLEANRAAARDARGSERDKTLLAQLRMKQAEARKARMEREKLRDLGKLKPPKPKPVATGPNPLGV